MKRAYTIMALTLTLVLAIGVTAYAFRGNCTATGAAMATCLLNITEGTPITLTGTVVSGGFYGKPLVIDTGSTQETIYGLGPIWFWENSKVERPKTGETVTIQGYELDFTTGKSIIAASVTTMSGQTLKLRDDTDGTAAWRTNTSPGMCRGYDMGRGYGQGMGGGYGRGRGLGMGRNMGTNAQ